MAITDGGTLNAVTVTAERKKMPSISAGSVFQLKRPDPLEEANKQALAHNKTIGESRTYKQYKEARAGDPLISRDAFRLNKGKSELGSKLLNAGDKVGDALKSGLGTVGNALASNAGNALMDVAAGLMPDKGKNTAFKEQQQIGNALMKVNPMVGGIYKAASFLGELTGTNVSKLTSEQAQAAGINGMAKTLNNLAAYIPAVGVLGSTMDAQKSHLIDEMAGAYGGTASGINTAGTMGGQNYLFGKGKAQDYIALMNERNRTMTKIGETNTLRKQTDYGIDLAQQNLNRYAGQNYMDMRMGRSGLKLDSLIEIRTMLANRQPKNEEIEKFAHGGVLEGTNLIPSGKLHKELHHIEDSDSELAENLTRKGIPVVALSEGGEIEQVAEIEHSEITLSKALTDKLEELRKDGSEEAMIEAGKILVEEIMFNTDDKMGIINEEDSVNNK